LVVLALTADELGVRVVAVGPPELPPRDGELEARQVRARQEADEIGGRERQAAVARVHDFRPEPAAAAATTPRRRPVSRRAWWRWRVRRARRRARPAARRP